MFKVGDKVYHIEYGWGVVTEENQKVFCVNFKIGVVCIKVDNNLLSFTEYSLQGFSQERQIELPQVGELCLFRDYDEDTWKVRKFDRYTSYSEFPFFDGSSSWRQMKRIKILD